MSLSAWAQEDFIQQPARQLTKIKFTQLIGGVIIIKAQLKNHPDSLTFILDTGSGGISLDSSTVSVLGITPSEPERIVRGVGGVKKVGFVKNNTLIINGLAIDSLNFHVLSYEMLSSLYGIKIDGIIGYAVFTRYIVQVNYDSEEVEFWSNGMIKYPKGGHLIKPKLNTIPLSSAQIKDDRAVNFNYLFDLGAGLTVLFSEDYIADNKFLKKKRKRYLKQGEGMGGKIDVYITVMKKLKIGPYVFRNVPVNIFNDEYNITSYPQLGGLIGNDIFRRFNCILNYAEKEIYLLPNKTFKDPFDYAYSGIELYLIGGRIVAGEIPKDSPAFKAGLKTDDEILGVNNRIGLTITELKHELQSKTGNIKVIYKRNDELKVATMKVISILNGKAPSGISQSSLTTERKASKELSTPVVERIIDPF